jgi:hypothetical protein
MAYRRHKRSHGKKHHHKRISGFKFGSSKGIMNEVIQIGVAGVAGLGSEYVNEKLMPFAGKHVLGIDLTELDGLKSIGAGVLAKQFFPKSTEVHTAATVAIGVGVADIVKAKQWIKGFNNDDVSGIQGGDDDPLKDLVNGVGYSDDQSTTSVEGESDDD